MKVLRSLCITFVICFRTKLCYSGIAAGNLNLAKSKQCFESSPLSIRYFINSRPRLANVYRYNNDGSLHRTERETFFQNIGDILDRVLVFSLTRLNYLSASCGECPKYPGCRRNSDCTEVTCDDKFLNQDVHSVMKLNLCKFPLSLTVKISVQGSTWSHTFTSLEDVPMAKFQNNVGVVQVRGQLTENQKKPKKAFIKLQLRAIPLVMKSSGDFQNVTIAEETIGGIERGISDCGVIEWYRDQESIYQALIIAGLVVGGLIFLTGCCFCCCCCRPCRSRRIKTTVVVHKDDEMPFRNIEGSYKLNTPASLQ